MIKSLLKYIVKTLNIFVSLFNNLINKIENNLSEDNLTLLRTSRNLIGRNIGFILNNDKLLERKELFYAIYMFLMNNKDLLDFGFHKFVIVNGRNKKNSFNLHHNILIKNKTTFLDY
jgi:hypothetical protein